MAGMDDVFKGSLLTAAAVGVGAVILAPVVMPILVSVGRPLAKSTIKGGMVLFHKSRETFAELSEVFDDLVAEARTELHATTQQAATAASAAAAESHEHPPQAGSSQQAGSPAA